MLFWLIAAAMLAAVVAILLASWLRKPVHLANRSDYEVAIYRDQLAEIDREVEGGLISGAEAEAAETEVSRRLLVADRQRRRVSGSASKSQGKGLRALSLAAGLSVFLAMTTVGMYLHLGSPGAWNSAQTASAAREAIAAEHQSAGMSEAVQRLAARLRANPNDLDGWVLLARSYTAISRFKEAAETYKAALGLAADDPDLRSAYGEALVLAARGTVTPLARDAFDAVLASRPKDPRSRYYLGLAETQSGRGAEAIEIWQALEGDSPAGAPWLPALQQRIDETARQYQIALAPRQPVMAPQSGPDADDMRRIGEMPASEQDAMIRGMVARLADRLASQPDDLQGWLQLAKSYQVLGQAAKARDALEGATVAAAKMGPDAQTKVEQAKQALLAEASAPNELSLAATPQGQAQPAGPAGEQREMIRGMVERLAARLESEPEDAAGWLRLGRAYAVLGEVANARAAYGEALARQPGSLSLLQGYADATLETEATGAVTALPSYSITILRNLLAVDSGNPQALWLLGLVEAEAGRPQAAAGLWRRLQSSLRPGSARSAAVAAQMEQLEDRR